MVVAFQVYFSTKYRLYAQRSCLFIKPDGACKAVVVGESHGRHTQCLCLFQKCIQCRGAVKKAILRVDVQVNEFHCCVLVEQSVKKPVCLTFAQLIDATVVMGSGHAYQEAYRLSCPPPGRFSPPAEDAHDLIEAATPDEGDEHGVTAYMDNNRFINNYRHRTTLSWGMRPSILEQMY
jgi:hypothetical protein